jgi:hypothetical protein
MFKQDFCAEADKNQSADGPDFVFEKVPESFTD